MVGYKDSFLSPEDRAKILKRQQEEAARSSGESPQRIAERAEDERRRLAENARVERQNAELRRINEERLSFVPAVLEGHREAQEAAGRSPIMRMKGTDGHTKTEFYNKGWVHDEEGIVNEKALLYYSDYVKVEYDRNTQTLEVLTYRKCDERGYYCGKANEVRNIPANPESLISAIKRCESGALTRQEREEERRRIEAEHANDWAERQSYRKGVEG